MNCLHYTACSGFGEVYIHTYSLYDNIMSCIYMLTQTVGVTTTLPGTVPHNLSHSIVGPHEWNYWSRALHHNKQKREFPDLPNLSDLTPGQTVGLLVTSNGQLHLYLNGRHRKEIASGLPVNTPLWGAASVYGRCTKVKSEILSGESRHYYLCINSLI